MIVSGRSLAPYTRAIPTAAFLSGNYSFPLPDGYQAAPYQLPMLEPKRWNVREDIVTSYKPVEVYRIGNEQYTNDQGMTVPADAIQSDFAVNIYPQKYNFEGSEFPPLATNQSVLIRIFKKPGTRLLWDQSNIINNGLSNETIIAAGVLTFIVTNLSGIYTVTEWISPDFVLTGLSGLKTQNKSNLAGIVNELLKGIDGAYQAVEDLRTEFQNQDDQFLLNEMRWFAKEVEFSNPKYTECDAGILFVADYPGICLTRAYKTSEIRINALYPLDIGYYDGLWRALCQNEYVNQFAIATSPDLVNWNTTMLPNKPGSTMVYAFGKYYVPSGRVLSVSANLPTWTTAFSSADDVKRVFFLNNVLIAFCGSSIYWTTDGINWRSKQMSGTPQDITFANGKWYLCTSTGYVYTITAFGSDITSSVAQPQTTSISQIYVFDGKVMYVVSNQKYLYILGGGQYTLPIVPNMIAKVDHGYALVGALGAMMLSDDLTTWEKEDSMVSTSYAINKIVNGINEFVYVASYGCFVKEYGYGRLPLVDSDQYKAYIKILP